MQIGFLQLSHTPHYGYLLLTDGFILTWPGLVPGANETRVTGSIPQGATHRSTPESRSTRTGEQTSVGSRCSLKKTYFLRGAKDIWRHFHRYRMKE